MLKVRKAPVVNDPETGSLSSKPFMAMMLTRYSVPGRSLTSLVWGSVPPTVTTEGVPGTEAVKVGTMNLTETHCCPKNGCIHFGNEAVSSSNTTFLTSSHLLLSAGIKEEVLLFV